MRAEFCLVLLLVLETVTAVEDHYQVLNLSPSATLAEIQKSYRKLAREYHPDRNKDDPLANERFTKINEAYEVLSDQHKRRLYDENKGNNRRPHASKEEDDGDSQYELRISRRELEKLILESSTRPCVLLTIRRSCKECPELAKTLLDAVARYEQFGVKLGLVNLDEDETFSHRLNVNTAPKLVAFAGDFWKSLDHQLNSGQIVSEIDDLLRGILPQNLINNLTSDAKIKDFFNSGFSDGKVKVLISIAKQTSVSVAPFGIQLSTFRFRHQANFGWIAADKAQLVTNYFSTISIPEMSHSIQIFDETLKQKGAIVVRHLQSDLNKEEGVLALKQTLDYSTEFFGFLQLPRLTSKEMWLKICKADSTETLCVVLLSDDLKKDKLAIQAFQEATPQLKKNLESQDTHNTKFCYVAEQPDLIDELRHLYAPTEKHDSKMDVLFAVLKDDLNMSFELLTGIWDATSSYALEKELMKYAEELMQLEHSIAFSRLTNLFEFNSGKSKLSFVSEIIDSLTSLRSLFLRIDNKETASGLLATIAIGAFILLFCFYIFRQQSPRKVVNEPVTVPNKPISKVVEAEIDQTRSSTTTPPPSVEEPSTADIPGIIQIPEFDSLKSFSQKGISLVLVSSKTNDEKNLDDFASAYLPAAMPLVQLWRVFSENDKIIQEIVASAKLTTNNPCEGTVFAFLNKKFFDVYQPENGRRSLNTFLIDVANLRKPSNPAAAQSG